MRPLAPVTSGDVSKAHYHNVNGNAIDSVVKASVRKCLISYFLPSRKYAATTGKGHMTYGLQLGGLIWLGYVLSKENI